MFSAEKSIFYALHFHFLRKLKLFETHIWKTLTANTEPDKIDGRLAFKSFL